MNNPDHCGKRKREEDGGAPDWFNKKKAKSSWEKMRPNFRVMSAIAVVHELVANCKPLTECWKPLSYVTEQVSASPEIVPPSTFTSAPPWRKICWVCGTTIVQKPECDVWVGGAHRDTRCGADCRGAILAGDPPSDTLPSRAWWAGHIGHDFATTIGIQLPVTMIGAVFGKKGATLAEIERSTQCAIQIEPGCGAAARRHAPTGVAAAAIEKSVQARGEQQASTHSAEVPNKILQLSGKLCRVVCAIEALE